MNRFFGRLIAYVFLGSFCIAGPVLLVLGCGSALQRAALIYSGESTQGTIIAERPSGAAHPTFAPVFQFPAADGHTYTVISDVSGREDAFAFGQRVRVFYWPKHPETARIDAFSALWTLPLVFGTVGAGFSVIPALVLVSWCRRRRATGSVPEGIAPQPPGAPDAVSRGFRWTLGVLLSGGGAVLLFIGVKAAWFDSHSMDNSPVVLMSLGVLLTASGIQVAQWVAIGSRLSYALGAAAISAMAILFGWVAICGDAAGFHGSVGIGGTAVMSGGGSAIPARIAFGLGSLVLGLASLWAWRLVFWVRQ